MLLKTLVICASLSATSCLSIEEPKGTECVVYSKTHMTCYGLNPEQTDPDKDVPLSECIGCFVYPAKTRGEMQKHHSELHDLLEAR